MLEAPIGFVNGLRRMDDKLHVRWSDSLSWVIERDSIFVQDEIKWLKKREYRLHRRVSSGQATEEEKTKLLLVREELRSAANSRRVIITSKTLDQKLFNDICQADIRRYGGYSRYADEMEAREAAEEASKWRTMQNQREMIHYEMWGRRGVYDMLAGKKGTHKREQIRRGEKTITEALGISPRDAFWKKEEPRAPVQLVDEFGKPIQSPASP